MSDGDMNDVPSAVKSSLLGSLTKFAAVLGSLVALGQASSTWIDGIYKAKAERERTSREVQLAEAKVHSELAENYLLLILDRNKPGDDSRAIIFSALAEIKGHPLRDWARDRSVLYSKANLKLQKAFEARNKAAQYAEKADGHIKALEADIQVLNVQITENINNRSKAVELQDRRVALSGELAKARAARSVVIVTVEEAEAIIERSFRTDPTVVASEREWNLAFEISSLSSKINATLLKKVFSDQAMENIDNNVQYLQAALQEFKVSDPRMAAAIVATIAVENPSFGDYEEPVLQAERYEGRRDLGNIEPGDGVRFRGRGHIGLTGRANYNRVSKQLGLGTRLLDAPEDAKSPEVASRVLVAWFVDRQGSLLEIKDEESFIKHARRLVGGGLGLLDEFRLNYVKVIEELADAK